MYSTDATTCEIILCDVREKEDAVIRFLLLCVCIIRFILVFLCATNKVSVCLCMY